MRRATFAAIGWAFAVAVQACAGPAIPSASKPTASSSSISPNRSDAVPAIGRLAPAANMAVARAVHSATRLADGRVLVAGGCTTNGCDPGSSDGATAELYDPASGTFSATGSLTGSRDDHAARLLPDGSVILIGGWGASGVLASTDLFDPATGTFSPGPMMRSPRAGVVPVALDDGDLLIAGGFIDNRPTIASSELYDPRTGAMTPTGDMTQARGAYAAARLRDGRVLVVGGLTDGQVTNTAEIFDPASGAFATTGALRTARYKGGAATLPDGRVLVLGGSADIDGTVLYATTEIFDPVAGTFSDGPSMESPRYKLPDATVVLGNGDILVAGGARQPEVFRIATRSFVPVEGALDTSRLFLAAAPIDRQRVLLVGGYDIAIRPTAATWLFDDR